MSLVPSPFSSLGVKESPLAGGVGAERRKKGDGKQEEQARAGDQGGRRAGRRRERKEKREGQQTPWMIP